MELYLQFGYGMKQFSIDMAKDWGEATVILSPRDIKPNQLESWSYEFKKRNVKTLFDPQCYFPKSNHKNLVLYDYWDEEYCAKINGDNDFEYNIIREIYKYNNIANCFEFIIPAMMHEYDDDWFTNWDNNNIKLINATKEIVTDKKHILTIALPEIALFQKEEDVEKIVKRIEEYDIDGVYIIAYAYKEMYLISETIWISNLMHLCSGIKLYGKKVIMGYGNHQLLALSLTGIDAIASGNYLNVRRFTNKFKIEDDSFKKRSKWYYCAEALSEFKIDVLDMAYRSNKIDLFKPDSSMDNEYVDILFGKIAPSLVNCNETQLFKHYLNCLRIQIDNLNKNTFNESYDKYVLLLKSAEEKISQLESNGIKLLRSNKRNFKPVFEVNYQAIDVLKKARGFQLTKEWSNF